MKKVKRNVIIFVQTFSDEILTKSYDWHFMAFSIDSTNNKGYFVIDQRVGFEMITSDGNVTSGKGIHFNLDTQNWIRG